MSILFMDEKSRPLQRRSLQKGQRQEGCLSTAGAGKYFTDQGLCNHSMYSYS